MRTTGGTVRIVPAFLFIGLCEHWLYYVESRKAVEMPNLEET